VHPPPPRAHAHPPLRAHVQPPLPPDSTGRLRRAAAEDIHAACTEAFADLHRKCLAENPLSGSTITCVVVNTTRREVSCANVGDSSALLVPNLARMGEPPVELSRRRTRTMRAEYRW